MEGFEELGEGGAVMDLCQPCRAPMDRVEEGGFCFLCAYARRPAGAGGDAWEEEETRDAVAMLEQMIADLLGAVSTSQLVETLKFYYDNAVRTEGMEEWSSRSIYEHVHLHMNRDETSLINTSLTALQGQVLSLRDVAWESPIDGGAARPNLRHIATIDRLTRTIFDGIRLRERYRAH